jgi:hypothetical protein
MGSSATTVGVPRAEISLGASANVSVDASANMSVDTSDGAAVVAVVAPAADAVVAAGGVVAADGDADSEAAFFCRLRCRIQRRRAATATMMGMM